MSRPIRVVVIGDAHLHVDDRNDDRRAVLEAIYEAEKTAVPDLWVLLGDLNHRAMTIENRNWWAQYIAVLAGTAPVAIVRGNHDRPGDLDIFEMLDAVNPIDVCTVPAVHTYKMGVARGLFLLTLPYIDKGALLANKGSSAAGPELDLMIDGWANDVAKRCGAWASGGHSVCALTVGHLNVAGSKVGSHTNAGHEIELLPGHVDRLAEVGPVLLGHIHAAQKVGKAEFVGDIFPQDYGDYREKHYVVAKHTAADGWLLEYKPIKTPRMLDLNVAVKPDSITVSIVGGEIWPEAHVPFPLPTDKGLVHTSTFGQTDGDMRVRYEYDPAIVSTEQIDEVIAWIRRGFEGKRLNIEPRPAVVTAPRLAALATCTTMHERAAVYCGHTGQEWSEDTATMLHSIINEVEQGVTNGENSVSNP